MCTFWLSLVKKYIYIIYSSSYSDDWKYLHLHKVVSWCLDLHFFFLWSQWNASHIPGENVIQPKNKFDDLVHNLYTAKRNLRDSRNSKLSVLTGCLCRPLRRGATVSLHSDITRGGPEWLILGRQWSEKENKHHCLLAFLFLKTCLWKKKKKQLASEALIQQAFTGTSLVVQWLRFHSSTAGGTGLIPGPGTKIPHATWHGQKIIIIIFKKQAFIEWMDRWLHNLAPWVQPEWQTVLWKARRTGRQAQLARAEAIQHSGFPCGSGFRLPWLRAWPRQFLVK